MAIDLTSYQSVGTGLFARIEVEYYKDTPEATPTSTVLRFSDYIQTVTINSEQYLGLGKLVGITTTTSELRNSNGSITITISGIPDTSIAEIVNSRIKGCPVQVYRAMFDSVTGELLDIVGNPVGRFFGIVDNYTIDEDYDIVTRTSSNTLALVCSSTVEILNNKIAGRKTNPTSQKLFYTEDVSMDRVPNLAGALFNFGAPR
jgi:hypothetical protein